MTVGWPCHPDTAGALICAFEYMPVTFLPAGYAGVHISCTRPRPGPQQPVLRQMTRPAAAGGPLLSWHSLSQLGQVHDSSGDSGFQTLSLFLSDFYYVDLKKNVTCL